MIQTLVDEGKRVSLSTQVREAIIGEIHAGIADDNGKLPTMREIAQRYNVSLMTVQRAISRLVDEGVITAVAVEGYTFLRAQEG